MLYEKHKEKLQFRIGVLVENPTEKEHPVQLFGVDMPVVNNSEVKLVDYYCNHLFDDGNLTFLNNYIESSPIRVRITVIQSENQSQVIEPIYIGLYDPVGIGSIIPANPQIDPYDIACRKSQIFYSYVLNRMSEIRFTIKKFTSVLVEFIPDKIQKSEFENTQADFYNSLTKETNLSYRKDKNKYLFIM